MCGERAPNGALVLLLGALALVLAGCGEATPQRRGQRTAPLEGAVTITSITPGRSPVEGGVVVELRGSGFFKGFAASAPLAIFDTRLTFGGVDALELSIVTDELIELLAPPHAAGVVDVELVNPNGTALCPGCFSYYAPATLHGLAPAFGPMGGGTEVRLTGVNFTEDLNVAFGDALSPHVQLLSATEALVVAPASAAAGLVDVTLFNRSGTHTLYRSFRYDREMVVTALTPRGGPLSGGTEVTVAGRGLGIIVRASLGGVDAQLLPGGTEEHLRLVSPPSPQGGAVDLVLTSENEISVRLARAFVYYDAAQSTPSVVSLSPWHGALSGELVELYGTGFVAGMRARLGAAEVGLVVLDGNRAALMIPPGSNGAANSWLDLELLAEGVSVAALAQAWRYDLFLASLSPESGPSSGGELVTLTGAGFREGVGLEVLFGDLPATEVGRVDSEHLVARAPPAAGTRVDVVVREAADHTNSSRRAAAFEYLFPPHVARVSPDRGAQAGGTLVTLQGAGFEPGIVFLFGEIPLREMKLINAFTAVGKTPPGEVGVVHIETRLGEQRTATPEAFEYYDPINPGGGSSGGPLEGTLNVTVLSSRVGIVPVEGATVIVGESLGAPLQGRTNKKGQVTLSDASLVKAVPVTVMKEGYLTQTIGSQAFSELTVYLTKLTGSVLGPGPDMPPPVEPEPGGGGGGGGGSTRGYISGKVVGFKLPRALKPTESAYAEVWVAPLSLYATPPLYSTGYELTPWSPGARDTRDAREEHWKLTKDSDYFAVAAPNGIRTLYALYGIHDSETGTFTPILMGLRRGVVVQGGQTALDQHIVLSMHLDRSFPVTIKGAPKPMEGDPPLSHDLYAWLNLGNDGVVPIGRARGAGPLTFTQMPRLDGENFIFLDGVVSYDGASDSYAFRKQLGDLTQGVTLGPMLDFISTVKPDSLSGEPFDGTLQFAWKTGAVPDLIYVSMQLSSTDWRWQGYLPGDADAFVMPAALMAQLRGEAASSWSSYLYVSVTAVRTARFDFDSWTYGNFDFDVWSSRAEGTLRMTVAP